VGGELGACHYNNFDKTISGSTSTSGNFGTNLVHSNVGFISKTSGITSAINNHIIVIEHGLSGSPDPGSGGSISITSHTGNTNNYWISQVDSKTFTISWTGTGPAQFSWEAKLKCENQYSH
jgi:hypothetical protein